MGSSNPRRLGIYPLPCPSPFLSTAAAALLAVNPAYLSPFSRAFELNSMSLFAVSSMLKPQSGAVMHHVKSAKLSRAVC